MVTKFRFPATDEATCQISPFFCCVLVLCKRFLWKGSHISVVLIHVWIMPISKFGMAKIIKYSDDGNFILVAFIIMILWYSKWETGIVIDNNMCLKHVMWCIWVYGHFEFHHIIQFTLICCMDLLLVLKLNRIGVSVEVCIALCILYCRDNVQTAKACGGSARGEDWRSSYHVSEEQNFCLIWKEMRLILIWWSYGMERWKENII